MASGARPRTWRDWLHDHVRPRDVLALTGMPAALAIGILCAGVGGLDPAVRATGITASIGAVTTIIGYYFGRGEATMMAREAAQMRSLWIQAQDYALSNAAELEKTATFMLTQAGVDPGEDAVAPPKDPRVGSGRNFSRKKNL